MAIMRNVVVRWLGLWQCWQWRRTEARDRLAWPVSVSVPVDSWSQSVLYTVS